MTVTAEFKEASTRAAIRGLRGLEQTAIMLETYAPEIFPETTEVHGVVQKHFGRNMMEAAAQAIRDAFIGAVVEVERFPDDPASLIDQYGKQRQTLLEIAKLLQEATPDPAGFIRETHRLAKDALNSNLVEPLPPTTRARLRRRPSWRGRWRHHDASPPDGITRIRVRSDLRRNHWRGVHREAAHRGVGEGEAVSAADREFLFTYHFGGKQWGTSVFASSPSEAREKIKAVGMARYDGELVATIPAAIPGAGWFTRMLCWWKNRSEVRQ